MFTRVLNGIVFLTCFLFILQFYFSVHYDDNDQKWYGLGTKIGYRLRPEGETGHPQGTEAANAHSRKYNRVNNYF